ncbi:MAG: TrkA family potassium uptake protein [Blautia sp.]|nr:TrkA family potassium uptake protein [Blautia sp.]
MNKSIVVFGIGRFGKSIAMTLSENGADVMAVDNDEEIIEMISPMVSIAIQADLENEEAISHLGLEHMDAAVVAIGNDLAASIMAVMISKEKGVPYVIAKAANERMGEILKKVGADKIIFPELQTGIREARMLLANNFMEYFDIDKNLCMIEISPKKEWIGKTLKDLDLPRRYHVNVVAIKDHHEMRSHINLDKVLDEHSALVVITEKANLKHLVKLQ